MQSVRLADVGGSLMGALCLAGHLAVGCGVEPDSRALYSASLTLPVAEALASCAAISEDALSSECRAGVAARQARQDVPAAQAVCANIASVVWRDECYFLVSDGAELTGPPALETCRLAGRFADRCTQHAAHRDLSSRARALEVGQEDRLWSQAREVVASYHPDHPDDAVGMMANAAVAQQLAERWTDEPFDAADCGVASEEVCAMAYETHLYAAAERGLLDSACAGEHTAEAVAAAGVLSWTGDETVPLRVFERTCRSLARGTLDGRAPAAGRVRGRRGD